MESLKPCRAAATTPRGRCARPPHGRQQQQLCAALRLPDGTLDTSHRSFVIAAPLSRTCRGQSTSLPSTEQAPENAWPARRPVIRTCQYHPTVRGTGGLTGARADAREPSAAGLQCAPPGAARCVLQPCGRRIKSPGQQAARRLSLPPPRGANHASHPLLFPAAGCRARWRWSRPKALERSASPTSMR